MKLSYLIILSLFTKISFGQAIGQLKSDSDALAFLKNNFPALDSFQYGANSAVRSTETKKWDVADLDKNGKPDLLISGTLDGIRNVVYVVLAEGDSQYRLEDISPGGYYLVPVSIIKKIGADNAILLLQSVSGREWLDTLTFKYGVFLKYHAVVPTKKISLLHYRSSCPNDCPVYKLIIDSSNITMEAAGPGGMNMKPGDTLRGTYNSKLTREKFNELTELVNYIDVSSLNSNYSVSGNDVPTGIIEVVFTDGTFKRIDDYGKVGTPGLIVLHEYLEKLRLSQSWEK
jgi:hypothetical protein